MNTSLGFVLTFALAVSCVVTVSGCGQSEATTAVAPGPKAAIGMPIKPAAKTGPAVEGSVSKIASTVDPKAHAAPDDADSAPKAPAPTARGKTGGMGVMLGPGAKNAESRLGSKLRKEPQ